MTVARASVLACFGIALLAAAASCSYADDPPPYRPPALMQEDGVATGHQLYQRDCAWCHGDRGEGTPRAPDLVTGTNGPALTYFMLATGRMPIDEPDDRVRRGPVHYAPDEVDALVEYVTSLGGSGPAMPMIDPEAGDLGEGREIYNENCAACHSTTSIGGTLARGKERALEISRRSGFVAPGLQDSSADDVAAAVLTGPGNMPVFADAFDEQELNSLVRFVLYLRDTGNPGGGDLGRVGPVAEGAVAWVAGLGALLVLSRWIGSRVGGEGEDGPEADE